MTTTTATQTRYTVRRNEATDLWDIVGGRFATDISFYGLAEAVEVATAMSIAPFNYVASARGGVNFVAREDEVVAELTTADGHVGAEVSFPGPVAIIAQGLRFTGAAESAVAIIITPGTGRSVKIDYMGVVA